MMFDVGVETWGERETIIKYLWEEHSRWWGSDCKGCYTEPWRVCGAQGGRLGWNRVTRGERGGNERTGSQGAGSYMLMQTLAFFWVQWEDVGCGVGEWRDLRYFRRISPTPDWRRGHRRGRVEAGRPGRRRGEIWVSYTRTVAVEVESRVQQMYFEGKAKWTHPWIGCVREGGVKHVCQAIDSTYHL